MRTIDSSILVIKPSNLAWWHRSWTGRFVLAALLIAAAAFALMPDRTSAHHVTGTSIADHCKAVDDNAGALDAEVVDTTNGLIPGSDFNEGLQADCVALLTAAESLNDPNNQVNWIDVAETVTLSPTFGASGYTGVTFTDVDEDATAVEMRVTAIDLDTGVEGLTGTIAAEWANLTELKSLNLANNNLGQDNEGDSVAVPRSVWEFFDGLEADTDTTDGATITPGLNLNGNPNLLPSPTLNLKAVVTKNSDATVALSFDNIWYTTEYMNPEYRYSDDGGDSWGPADSEDGTADSEKGWMAATGTLCYVDSAADPLVRSLCSKLDADNARSRDSITVTPEEDVDTYIFEVRWVKEVETVEDDPGTTDINEREATTTKSTASRLDVVGPQTLTAGSMFSLKVAEAYTNTASDATDKLPDPTVDSSDADNIRLDFDPQAETEADTPVTVTLTQPHGSHTFPVTIHSADTAPKLRVNRIRPQEVVNHRRDTTLDLSRYFEDSDNLTFEADSSDVRVATVEIDPSDGSMLVIDPHRPGRTIITITATNPDQGTFQHEFRVTVVDPNTAPQLVGTIPDLTLYLDDEGTRVDMTQYFRDLDNDFLRFIPQSSNPMVLTARPDGRFVVFQVTGVGEVNMTIIAQDDAGATAFGSFKVEVLDPNDAPEAVGEIPKQQVRLESSGVAIGLGSYFTDANNDPLTYTAVSADEAIATVEVMEATATIMAVALGETTVTFTATDPGGKYAMQVAEVEVLPANMPPVLLMEIPDVTMQDDDEPLGLDVTMYFADPEGEDMDYVGEGNNESAAEVRVHSHGLVRVDAKEISPGAAAEVEITVSARDPHGASVSDTFIVTVQGNLPPEAVGSIEDQALLEGRDVLMEVAEYFNDPNGDELTYMATSDNPDAVAAVSIEGSQQIVLRGLSPAENVTVTVTAMDEDGESAAQLINVTVIAAAPPPTPTPEPTATPEPTTPPPPTATPAPTATPEPEDEGGFPVGLIIVLLLVLAGIAAAVFIIQRRR